MSFTINYTPLNIGFVNWRTSQNKPCKPNSKEILQWNVWKRIKKHKRYNVMHLIESQKKGKKWDIVNVRKNYGWEFSVKNTTHIFNQCNKFQAGKNNPQLDILQRNYRKLKTYILKFVRIKKQLTFNEIAVMKAPEFSVTSMETIRQRDIIFNVLVENNC